MDLFFITDIIGITSFALSGFLVGVRERLDFLGTTIVAFLTALGGGIIRDALVGRVPFSLTHILPVLLVLAVIFASTLFRIYHKEDYDQNLVFIITDAIGLASFSLTGSLVGIESNLSIFGVIIVSFTTAVGGGMVRDMLINRVPFILKKELYGIISIFIGLILYLLNLVGLLNNISLCVVFFAGIAFRLYFYFKKVHLPRF